MANDVMIHVKAKDEASKTFGTIGMRAKTSGGLMAGAFTKVHAATALAAVGAVKLASTVVGAGVKAVAFGVKVAAANEQAKISFTTMLGSAKKADAFLVKLKDFAAKTPFEFPELQTAASSLISVGVSAKNVIPIMTTLGNVTSGMGTGSEGVKRATIALQQMSASGRITAEDLNQLRDAGLPLGMVFKAISVQTGESTKKLMEMYQTGKLGRKELDALMKSLGSGKGFERFNGLMDAQSKSLTGMLSTLKDTFGQGMAKALQDAIPLLKKGMGKLSEVMADFFKRLEKLTKDKALRAALSDLGKTLKDMGEVDLSSVFEGLTKNLPKAIKGINEFVKAYGKLSRFIDKHEKTDLSKDNFLLPKASTIKKQMSGLVLAYKWMNKQIMTAFDRTAAAGDKLGLVPHKFAVAVHKATRAANEDYNKALQKHKDVKKGIENADIKAKLKADNSDAQKKYRETKKALTDKDLTKDRRAKLKAENRQALEAVRRTRYALQQLDGYTARVHIKTIYSKINAKNAGAPFHAAGGIVGGLGAHAAEGGPRGGRVWVGEQGPELVDLPMGSRVHSNADSKKMSDGGGPITLILDLGKGITQRLEIHDRDIRRAVAMGAR